MSIDKAIAACENKEAPPRTGYVHTLACEGIKPVECGFGDDDTPLVDIPNDVVRVVQLGDFPRVVLPVPVPYPSHGA